jgi:ABC-2 type transport system permease protein
MNPFHLFVRLRLRDAVGRPGRALAHFGLPAILLLLSGALFFAGRPFERRVLVVVGPGEHPASRADLRVEEAASESAALSRLATQSAQAVLSGRALYVGPREELFGRGLASLLGDVELVVVPVPEHAYLLFLFPGLLVWTILVNGLLGMAYNMARYRRTQFLKKLSLTPLSPYTFVFAQIAARAVLSLGQVAVLTVLAVIFFRLPLGLGDAAALAVVTLFGVVALCGAGFALAAAIDNEVTAYDVANAVTAVLLLLSGIFFPVADLPRPIALLADALPTTQLVTLLRDGLSPVRLGILAAWTLLLYVASVLLFRWTPRT